MSSSLKPPLIPLPERLRPENLDEFVGQEHLTGEGKPIRTMVESGSVYSLILWGPPGTGKTTLARIIAGQTESDFLQINAVSSGVSEIRKIIERARANLSVGRKTILFIDEIHRFNKAQQDALLSAVEKGELILIGATTENPSFEVIPALRSRLRIYTLEELNKDDLSRILDRALNSDEFIKRLKIAELERDFLIYVSGGDARALLTILELTISQFSADEEIKITKEKIENVIQKKNIIYDKAGEEHYNLISAFIKSIRGSDPDAALYWMARMLEGGEDPLFIARRMVILASEDIGNASPNALVLAEACFSAVHKIGMPEARIILAQCATYLAASPKSNAAYKAIEGALDNVRKKPLYPVPKHLRNAPTRLMKELGYSLEYKYPHGYKFNFVEENYLPEKLKGKQYYFPTENGQEKKLKDWLRFLWKGRKKY